MYIKTGRYELSGNVRLRLYDLRNSFVRILPKTDPAQVFFINVHNNNQKETILSTYSPNNKKGVICKIETFGNGDGMCEALYRASSTGGESYSTANLPFYDSQCFEVYSNYDFILERFDWREFNNAR